MLIDSLKIIHQIRGRIQTLAESFPLTSMLFYLPLRQDDARCSDYLPKLQTAMWWKSPLIAKEGRKQGGREERKEEGREGEKKEMKHKISLSSELGWLLCNSINVYWLPGLPSYARHCKTLKDTSEGVFVFKASLSSLRMCFWEGHLFEPEFKSPWLGPVVSPTKSILDL